MHKIIRLLLLYYGSFVVAGVLSWEVIRLFHYHTGVRQVLAVLGSIPVGLFINSVFAAGFIVFHLPLVSLLSLTVRGPSLMNRPAALTVISAVLGALVAALEYKWMLLRAATNHFSIDVQAWLPLLVAGILTGYCVGNFLSKSRAT